MTGAAVVAFGALTAPASADIFAVIETLAPAPRTDIDVAEVDASTGTFGQLPAGINTSANEFHPSVSFDGTRIVFERVDPAAGTHRIILAEPSTGKTADVFNAFEIATDHPTSPALDGPSNVLTGGPFTAPTETDVSSFPGAGPYPHKQDGSSSPLVIADPFLAGISIQGFPSSAYRVKVPQLTSSTPIGQIIVDKCCDPTFTSSFSTPAFRIFSSNVSYAHPTIAGDANPVVILFDQHTLSSSGGFQQSDIGVCNVSQANATSCDTLGLLPPIVDSAANETRPALTPDDRYVGFIRDESNGHERLFIWDTVTQTMLNSGVDLGLVHTPDSGNLSLFVKPVFRLNGISSINTVNFSLLQSSSVGILVQRVVGHHKLFGRTVPTLKPVGRVPFGNFRSGRRHVHWNLRVNGRRLVPGTYQVTVRALTNDRRVHDMGKPHIIRVRH